MGQYGSMVADAATVGLRYANRLITGVPADRFARMSAPAGQTIVSNHPAFALGHLSLYPIKVLQLLGQDTASVQPPSNFEQLFSKDAKCQDDTAGTIYPSSDEIVAFFNSSYQAAIDALRKASDEQFTVDNPVDTPIKQVCPTLGAMLTFYVTGHVTMHLGQLSTWRRMEGLPPV